MSLAEMKLVTLLRDFGYRVSGNDIIQLAIGRYSPEKLFRRCRDVFDAADQLRPIINDAEYSRRHTLITRSQS